jgi:hypothetical protein
MVRDAHRLARRNDRMTRSIERILTTHVGSLPRADALVALLY